MSFLTPALLFFSLLATLPILLHLINKRKSKRVVWAATQFLQETKQKTKRQLIPRHLLVLLFRVLVSLALLLIVSKPLWVGGSLWSNSESKQVILIVDSSAYHFGSIDGEPQMVRALRNAKKDMEKQGLSGSLFVASQNLLIPFEEESERLLGHNFLPIITQLRKLSQLLPQGSPEPYQLWILSSQSKEVWDLQSSEWNALTKGMRDQGVLPEKVKVLFAEKGREADYALELGEVQFNNESLEVQFSTVNAQSEEMNKALSVTFSTVSQNRTYQLQHEGVSKEHSISIPISEQEKAVSLSLARDGNVENNTFYLTKEEQFPLKAVIVSESDSSSETQNAFRRAASLLSLNQSASVLSPEEFSTLDLSGISLVLWNSSSYTSAHRESLNQYLEAGGTVLIAQGQGLAESQGGNQAPLCGTTIISEVEDAPRGVFFSGPEEVLKSGPWSFTEKARLPLEPLRAIQRTLFTVDSAQVVARWRDGEPLLTQESVSNGVVYCLGTLPEESWSNLAGLGLHVVLIQNLYAEVASRLPNQSEETELNRKGTFVLKSEEDSGREGIRLVEGRLIKDNFVERFPVKLDSQNEIKSFLSSVFDQNVAVKKNGHSVFSLTYPLLVFGLIFLIGEQVFRMRKEAR